MLLGAQLLLALQATAVTIPERPPRGSYVVDDAKLLDAASIAQINRVAANSAERGRPIYVVTVVSLAAEDAQALTVPEYARRIFDAWRIGGGAESRGALLLVSAQDRTARIELGHAWNNERDAEMRRIMSANIVPAMRKNEPTEGIVAATANIAGAISPWSVGTVMRAVVAIMLAAGLWMLRRVIPFGALFGGRREQGDAELSIGPGGTRLDPNARTFNPNFRVTDRSPRRRPNERLDGSVWGWGGEVGDGGGSSDDGGSSSGGGGATGSW